MKMRRKATSTEEKTETRGVARGRLRTLTIWRGVVAALVVVSSLAPALVASATNHADLTVTSTTSTLSVRGCATTIPA